MQSAGDFMHPVPLAESCMVVVRPSRQYTRSCHRETTSIDARFSKINGQKSDYGLPCNLRTIDRLTLTTVIIDKIPGRVICRELSTIHDG